MSASSFRMPDKNGPVKSEGEEATIAVDPHGDLTLVVGSDTKKSTFLVCSRSLSRSSPVFRAMLYGSFREARPADINSWVVELPDDSGTPAAILFDIVHGRFRMVPLKLATLDALYQVLSFADKYDMISLLVPWIQEWVSSVPPLQGFLFGGGPTAWTIWKAVAVSRELGALCPLKELVRRIIMTTGIDSSGKLLWAEYPLEFMGSQEMPLSSPEIFEHAAKLRLGLVTEIFKRLRTMVLGLRVAIPARKAFSCKIRQGYGYINLRNGDKSAMCHSSTLGFIISGLGQEELKVVCAEPNVSADPLTLYPFSVQNLVQKLKIITVIHHVDEHEALCNPLPSLIADIDRLIAYDAGHLTEETLAYLERQRTKYGVLDVSGLTK